METWTEVSQASLSVHTDGSRVGGERGWARRGGQLDSFLSPFLGRRDSVCRLMTWKVLMLDVENKTPTTGSC